MVAARLGAAAVLSLVMFPAGCSGALMGQGGQSSLHTTYITSEPLGARLYVDGNYLGETPTQYQDDPGLPRDFYFVLRLKGYKTIVARVEREQSFVDSFLGFGWRLRKHYEFTLEPLHDASGNGSPTSKPPPDQ